MKLKKFDSTNCQRTHRKGIPIIRFGSKGAIWLSRVLVEKIKLSAGDTIAIVQDEDEPTDWYITKDKDGFMLRKTSIRWLTFNNAVLSKNVLEALGYEDSYASFRVVTEPVIIAKWEYYPILTASGKKREE